MTKKKEKRITNAELLESINRSFSKVEAKIDTVDTKVSGLETKLEGVTKRIDDLAETKVSKVTYKELEHRVGFIEEKLELKAK